jgi:uncharacterized protein (UPF0276 family)
MATHPALAGAGVVFNPQHIQAILADPQRLDFLQVAARSYLTASTDEQQQLHCLAEYLPVVVRAQGVSLTAASLPAQQQMQPLVAPCRRYCAAWMSVRISAPELHGGVLSGGAPLAYNSASLQRACQHLERWQNSLGRQLLIENPASYLPLAESDMSQAAFLAELTQRSGCGLLLNVTNLLISSHNCDLPVASWLATLPLQQVLAMQLSGHRQVLLGNGRTLWLDEPASAVADASWQLFAELVRRVGALPCVLAWEGNLPAWSLLAAEVDCVRTLQDEPYMPAARSATSDAAGRNLP